MKGRGLNSIPIRFSLITAVLTTLCAAAQIYLWVGVGYEQASVFHIVAVVSLAIIVPTAITWAAATKLTGHIRALHTSTEAIVAGDFESPIEVDCACEVGGLADSFRKMVGRLNSNILRMNVLAYSDAITGLPNRIVATHMLEHLTAAGNNGRGAVLFIDLDGFKRVNDTFGHEAGDELLRQVSVRIVEQGLDRTFDRLDTCTTPFGELCERPPEDIVFVRFAGDEFVAILPGVTDIETIERAAVAILRSLEMPFDILDNPVTISASIGVARTPVDSEDAAELLSFADLAMYAAKEAGKSCFRFFDHSMHDVVLERNIIESDLREALTNDEMTLFFQPKFESRNLDLDGVEALVRWNHPTRGMVSPGTFIPIAEQAGLMSMLGSAIMRMAVRQCRLWLDAGISRSVAINVSPLQFENPRLVPEILSLLDEYDVDPGLIELEITESTLMSDFAKSRFRVEQLQSAGIQISIDDFGIGFSNLSHLAKLPFNALKIDQSLIADIGTSGKSESIVKAMVGMAHALGQKTVAEGIEKPEQLHFLQQIRCDKVQGFLLAHPMSAPDLERWRQERSRNTVGRMQEKIGRSLIGPDREALPA